MRLLVLPNGHGEDVVACTIIDALVKILPGLSCEVMPLVGEGMAFVQKGWKIVGPRKTLPSQGLINNDLGALWKDLKHGLVKLIVSQFTFLCKDRKRWDAVLAVGDRVPLFFARFAADLPTVFIGVAQTVLAGSGYSFLERLILKKCHLIFTRDLPTAKSLCESGIDAKYAGNPILDAVPRGDIVPDSLNSPVVLLFPGSREQQLSRIHIFLKVVENLQSSHPYSQYYMPLAPTVSCDQISKVVIERSWDISKGDSCYMLHHLQRGIKIHLVTSGYAQLLEKAHLVIGVGGTVLEQAALYNCPLITFPTDNRSFYRYFMNYQKQIIGDKLTVCPPDIKAITDTALEIMAKQPDCYPENYSITSSTGKKENSTLSGIAYGIYNFLTKLETFKVQNMAIAAKS